MKINYWIIVLLCAWFFSSCEEQYTPKPKGYFRLTFPEKQYQKYEGSYPYNFEFPTYARIVDYKPDSGWMNIYFPCAKATMYLTYKNVLNNTVSLSEQTRTFAYKHTIKADAIDETPFVNAEKKVYGILYDIKGNAASSLNFYLTDSSKHFLSAALYFSTRPNKDSLAPALDFLRKDMLHFIETFEWNDK
jgi:gliding motility-associated lipoprotein GldD